MIGDHYSDKWRLRLSPPWENPYPSTTNPYPSTTIPALPELPGFIAREEFDELKRDVAEMKALLKRAKQYDEEHNEPNCEMEEKIEILRRMAELCGVDLEDVLGTPA